MHVPNNIFEAAQALQEGSCTPLDLVEGCLERIEQHEDAVKSLGFDRRRRGSAGRERTGSNGATREDDHGPLWGIPIGIKDVFDVAGKPTQAGSPLRKNHRAIADSFAVQKLRSAGAIMLGKTVTTEFACFDPPPTRNPWDTSRTPGGSSSGSAAALTLGMCLGRCGNANRWIDHPSRQLLRRVRAQADFRAGELRRRGRSHHASRSRGADGPFGSRPGNSVRGHGGLRSARPVNEPARGATLPGSNRSGSRECAAHGPTWMHYFFDEADEAITVDDQPGARSARISRSVDCPWRNLLPVSRESAKCIAASWSSKRWRCTERHFLRRRDEYGPNIASLLDEGTRVSAVDYADAVRHQKCFQQEILEAFEGVDVLVMPATDSAAPIARLNREPQVPIPLELRRVCRQ